MSEIITLTNCLVPYLSTTQLKQLRPIVLALLSMTGRVTMLGLSRWSEGGGSYRTLQRWFQTPLEWGVLLWAIIRTHFLDPQGVYLLAGRGFTVGQRGQNTL